MFHIGDNQESKKIIYGHNMACALTDFLVPQLHQKRAVRSHLGRPFA